jgi:AAA family ATP:ADP antiporter
MAYYVLKPVREALILGEATAEIKSYLSAGQVVLLGLVVPLYGRLVASMNRRRLLNSVNLFFVACLIAFYALGHAGAPVGIAFFLWIGIFNMMIVAQFWSFANDIYTKDEGERLFPIVGFGASLGAVVGAWEAGVFLHRVGVFELLLIGAALLAAQLLLTNYIDRREEDRQRSGAARPAHPGTGKSAFALVWKTRYLLLIALMLGLHNWVKTTGEYILGSIVRERAIAELGAADAAGVQRAIGGFYSCFFTYVNILGLLLQLFVVSRVVRYFKVSKALLFLPIISLSAYSVIVLIPLLRAVLVAKVAENATDYSLNNTIRNMLFLPCTTEQKYSAKQAIDSFFVRVGDVLSAGVVFAGTQWLGFGAQNFALVNAGLVVVWLLLAWRIGRYYQQLSDSGRPPVTTA